MQKALLIILDGYGIAVDKSVSAIDRARKPYLDDLFSSNPSSQLIASGKDVGLPEGQFGNSEVGHLNIGAGRIVWQDISRIDNEIETGSFFENDALSQAADLAAEKGKIHIMGLFSDGGVHSHNRHLTALLKLCKSKGLDNVYVHAFTDGRDTAPKGGVEYARAFNAVAKEAGVGELASIVGRYYAMDRDNRWERVKKAYDLLVRGIGTEYKNSDAAFEANYGANITDEFLEPCLLSNDPYSRIAPGDVVIFYNFRGDRARQITRALTETGFDGFDVTND